MSSAVRRAGALLGAALALGCSTAPSESGGARPIAVVFSRADAAAAFPGDYISVLDTAILDITSSAAPPATHRVRLGQRDSVARFSVVLDTGNVLLVATIVSNNGTRLFLGRLQTRVLPSTDSLDIVVQPQTAVLLLALSFTVQDNGVTRTFSTRVHNRGAGPLTWNVATTPPGCVSMCTFTPPGGTIQANSSVPFVISAPSAAFPTPPKATLASAAGRVTIP